jgi:hypothetical protein
LTWFRLLSSVTAPDPSSVADDAVSLGNFFFFPLF